MFVLRHSNLKVYVHHYIFVFIKQSSIVLVSGLKICQWHFQHICCKNKGLLLFLLFFIFACMTLVVKHQLKVALSKKILRQYCEEEMWVLGFPNHECQKSCHITSRRRVICKEFLAWVIWKTQYSHFRSHSIDIVENYKYA